MAVIGLYEARTHWSEVIDRVERGERFTITRYGVPIADLIPASERRQRPIEDVFTKMREARSGRRLEGVSLRDLIREAERR